MFPNLITIKIFLPQILYKSTAGGGGRVAPNRTWMCLPGLENLTISIPIFLLNFPPIGIPFSKETNLTKYLGAFYNNLPKIHPIYVIRAPSSLMKTPRSLYQISQKSAPKGRHIYLYHVNVRPPPPRVDCPVFSSDATKLARKETSDNFITRV